MTPDKADWYAAEILRCCRGMIQLDKNIPRKRRWRWFYTLLDAERYLTDPRWRIDAKTTHIIGQR